MESQNPPSQTPTGGDETIALQYRKLWGTKVSDNRYRLGYVCEDDLEAIHKEIGPAAADWEAKNGQIYTNSLGPIDDGHAGVQGAKIVPVTLNLHGEKIHSFAGDRALDNNDFTALSQRGLPDGDRPQYLARWRPRDSHLREKKRYPSRFIVWEDTKSREDLYALIPKPLEGMSRAGCDHCRIHNPDPDRAAEHVKYYDDRPHVNDFRKMSAGETAITPFSLCWFHWWYVWTGELLRPSHIHALELHVGGELRERWGISHMRELLLFVKARFSTAEESLENDLQGGREPGPGPTQGAWLNTVGRAAVEELDGSNPSNLQGETVTSRDPDQMAAGSQAVSATTADGPNTTSAGGQSTVAPADPDLMRDQRQEIRQLVLNLPMMAARRRGVLLPKAKSYFDGVGPQIRAQDGNRPAVQGNNGDSRLVDGSGASQSATNSAPSPDFPHHGTIGPAGPSRTNQQPTPSRIRASPTVAGVAGDRASQANGPVFSSSVEADILLGTNSATAATTHGLIPSNTEAPVPHPQTDDTPAPREDGFLRSPPTEPRLMRRHK